MDIMWIKSGDLGSILKVQSSAQQGAKALESWVLALLMLGANFTLLLLAEGLLVYTGVGEET